jgi:branched-chain amino acid transport system ATP-binding protein
MTSPLLEVESLDAHYGVFQALFGVSLEVAEGESVAVVGANGAGKSTLLKTIVGLLAAAPEAVRLEGEPIGGQPTDRIAERGVFLVPEGRRIFATLTVEENLLIGAHTRRAGPWNLDAIYQLFPVLVRRRRNGGTQLSGGEQQMLAIGRGLMANPRLLLLDEISLGLAPSIVRGIYGAISDIEATGTTIVIVEQDIRQAMAVVDHLYCLQKGTVALTGNASEIDHDDLVAAYFGLER